jgi:uncharacterized repeat protein (TIGR03803 family)
MIPAAASAALAEYHGANVRILAPNDVRTLPEPPAPSGGDSHGFAPNVPPDGIKPRRLSEHETAIASNMCTIRAMPVSCGAAGIRSSCLLVILAATPAWVEGQVTEILVHQFQTSDGATPLAGLIRDTGGNLYGTTAGGGSARDGVVYKLDSAGNETVLHSFAGFSDGAGPRSGVIADGAGNLYGTTAIRGAYNAGVIYKLSPAGKETLLYSFTGTSDGGHPSAGVIRDATGNLYGTAVDGGAFGHGVVYKLDPAGNEAVLHSFTGGADGGNPFAGVVFDPAGNLWGTTNSGGMANKGTVYVLDPSGHETVIHSFTAGADGAFPYAGVTFDRAGNLYGTTSSGGLANAGVVYKLDRADGHETVLYRFTGGLDGASPWAEVLLDPAGNIYGTTVSGGATGLGLVFRIDNSGHETVLYSFMGGTDGIHPYSGLIADPAGNLYGSTRMGGYYGRGVVFEIKGAGFAN